MGAELVVIGTSLGGLTALKVILGGLAADFTVPIAVVQHRHRDSDHMMSDFLRQFLQLPIVEVEDKDPIVLGHIYLAPPDYHLLVEPGYFALSIDEPVLYARPSIDVLFESAADTYGAGSLGVVLTGTNRDGARGLARIRAAGGQAIVQDPATAEGRVMPEAAIAATPTATVLPLETIAAYLTTHCDPWR
ncbi:MAG TPA: chemotaxis protein CheB [Thermosynechococcaceae cyanobacterium]